MAGFTERAVIDPRIWLAWSDIQNRSTLGNPFIENFTKGIKESFSKFRLHSSPTVILDSSSVENPDYLPVLNKRFIAKVPLGFVFYGLSLVLTAFIQDNILHNGKAQDSEFADTIEWQAVTLPWKITDDWMIDQSWIKENCDDQGKPLGTGIPPEPEIDQSELEKIREWVKDNKLDNNFIPHYDSITHPNLTTASMACETFGASNQLTP